MELKHKVTDQLLACDFEHARLELYHLIEDRSTADLQVVLNERIKECIQTNDQQRLSVIGESLLAISRMIGKRHVIRDFATRSLAATPCPLGMLPIGGWLQTDLVRTYLIAQVFSQSYDESDRFKVLYQLYDASDTEGKVACLRSLHFMQGQQQDGLEIIHDAGRTYLSELLEAAWCNNLFSSSHMSTEEFRKAVMKALFCDVSIEGFLGIDRAADQELSRRLCEFANEREAAERTVPLAVWQVAAYYPVEGLVARLIGRLEHPKREERLCAAISLLRANNELALPFIESRLIREEDPEIHSVLSQALPGQLDFSK